MKKSMVLMLGLSAVLAGCASNNTVTYGDAQAVETKTVDFGSTDLHKIASDMVDSMMMSPSIAAITQKSHPIVFVERIKNKTSEHIDTESITDTISTRMLNSGKFQFVDMGRVEAVRAQLKFQNDDQLVDKGSAIQFGKMVGAQYMLYGNLSSIVKDTDSSTDVYYKMTMRLMDIRTGLIVWADESEIRKDEKKGFIGF